MILGIGTDLINAQRIEQILNKHGEAFIYRFFTEEEREQGEKRLDPQRRALFYASRFAAKEACAKALGTGIQKGIAFHDIVVLKDSLGKPFLDLRNAAKEYLLARVQEKAPLKQAQIDLSLTDEYPLCMAFVVISMEE